MSRPSRLKAFTRSNYLGGFSSLTPLELGDETERIAATALGAVLAPRNAVGYDMVSPNLGKIEVRARILGTDGPWPRVTLTEGKVKIADHVLAVRWRANGAFEHAVMLCRSAAQKLYLSKRQTNKPQAHIAWKDWISDAEAIDVSRSLRATWASMDRCAP